jgi:hypothetical protein
MEGRKEKRGNERQEEEEWGRDGGEEIRAFVCCDTTLTGPIQGDRWRS